ncbi:MAG: DEAD/DEAH box helicase [Marinilabiliales bacterium]|nr:DEAD/DEAH box helicase [Marinilabiliales bacterium]
MTFRNLGIIEPILQALEAEGYHNPDTHSGTSHSHSSPQVKILLGCAQTGTGKTAAFAIPILQHLYTERQGNNPDIQEKYRALVVTPDKGTGHTDR